MKTFNISKPQLAVLTFISTIATGVSLESMAATVTATLPRATVNGTADRPIQPYVPTASISRHQFNRSQCWVVSPTDDQSCFNNHHAEVDPIFEFMEPDPAKGKMASFSGVQCGNPVVVASGNKIETEIDYEAEGDFPLAIVKNYNAHSGISGGLFGPGYMSKFDMMFISTWIGNDEQTGQDVYDYRLYRDDGTTIRLEPGTNSTFKLVGVDESVARVITNPQGHFVYQAADGSEETYAGYKLIKIKNPQGVTWTFNYRRTNRNQEVLASVTHSNGRSLIFNIDDTLVLTSIITPAGDTFSYQRWHAAGWR